MKTYIFKFTSLDHRSEDGSKKLDYLLGTTIAYAMLNNNNPLELVRLKHGSETIIARKQLNEVKLVILGEGEYPIRKIRNMHEK